MVSLEITDMSLIIASITAIVLLFDLWLVLKHKATISHRYQAWAPTYVDLVLLGLLTPLICHVSLHPTLKIILAILMGHVFFPNKERYVP